MKASDLQGKRVRTRGGTALGRVTEIRVARGEVTALTCGGRGWLQRFTASRGGHRVAWREVVEVNAREIVIADR